MKMFNSLAEFAGFTTGMIVELDHIKRECLEKGAKIIEQEAKRVIGTYDYGWEELHEPTKKERERLGLPPDEPLLREGELRDSIEHTIVSSEEAQIGSNNQKAVWHELGTSHFRARPFLSQAAIHKEAEIARVTGGVVIKTLEDGKAPRIIEGVD